MIYISTIPLCFCNPFIYKSIRKKYVEINFHQMKCKWIYDKNSNCQAFVRYRMKTENHKNVSHGLKAQLIRTETIHLSVPIHQLKHTAHLSMHVCFCYLLLCRRLYSEPSRNSLRMFFSQRHRARISSESIVLNVN